MGLFDFLRPRRSGPSAEAQAALVQAMARLTRQDSPSARVAFEKALSEAILLLGVRNVPPSIGPGATVLEDDTAVAVLHASTPEGLRVLFAFTSPDEVNVRSPEAGIIGLPSREVLEMVLQGNYDLLAINPGGDVLEITRDEIAAQLV